LARPTAVEVLAGGGEEEGSVETWCPGLREGVVGGREVEEEEE